jgi:hypothetical protein
MDAGHVCREHCQSRLHAIERVIELASQGRSLIGFDFAFGVPTLSESAPTGRDLAAFFRSQFLTEGAKEGCRFRAASSFNHKFGDGVGPFYSRVSSWKDVKAAGLINTPTSAASERSHRVVDLRTGANSPWQMAGQGSVGSQTVVGLAWLDHLLDRLDASLWPFEPITSDHVVVEIYPTHHQREYLAIPGRSLFTGINDERQVAASAEWFRSLDQAGAMKELLSLDGMNSSDRAAARAEGWILGVR